MIAIQPIYWRVSRIYRKHRFLYGWMLGRVYRAVAWKRVDQIRYNICSIYSSWMHENRCSLPRAVITDVEFGVTTGWIVVMGVTTAHKIRVTPNQLKETEKQSETCKHERADTHRHKANKCSMDEQNIISIHNRKGLRSSTGPEVGYPNWKFLSF
jgi:hypothetical protein